MVVGTVSTVRKLFVILQRNGIIVATLMSQIDEAVCRRQATGSENFLSFLPFIRSTRVSLGGVIDMLY